MRFISKLVPKRMWKQIVSGAGIAILLAFSGFVVFEMSKTEVTLAENGEKQTINTHAKDVEELLAEAGISYDEHDDLSHELDTAIKNDMTVTYDAANQVTVLIDGEKETYFTTSDTVGEFFKDENIQVNDRDDTSRKKDASIDNDTTIKIDKAFQVMVNDGGSKEKVWTNGGNVQQLLNNQDIELNKLDKVTPAKSEKVQKDTPVTITRMKKVTKNVTESVDYQVKKRNDSSLEKGKKNVIADGQEGLVTKTYEVTKKNGETVDRDLIDKNVQRESKDRIVAIGTKAKGQNLTTLSAKSSSDNNSKNKNADGEVMYMNATAYSANCSGCSGVTATGINLNANRNKKVVAVDTSVIPLGTKVWVEGYGTAVAGDTGGNIVGNRIDLHVPTQSAASAFGRKTVKVKILD
ncbi:ubiquitin-like domain-containing protein [Lentibacillus halophilus]|uniref:Ubiquitin-like domain-containing protein n=1 Tax=Lentibacillus halophilus TaxID=295065 RepID=A0ABN0Z917_9BACI